MLNLTNYTFSGFACGTTGSVVAAQPQMTLILWVLWFSIIIGVPLLYWVWRELNKKGEKTNDGQKRKG